MLISIFFLFKTFLYLNFTQIEFNRIPIFLITWTITMLILSLINLTKLKHRDTFKMIFYSLISFIMFVDVIYYAQFGSLPSVDMLGQAKQLTAVVDSIKYLLQFKNLLLILDIPILILITSYIKKRDINIEILKISKLQKTYISLGILILTVVYLGITGQGKSVVAQELYSFHALDIVNNLKKAPLVEENNIFTEEDLEEIKNRTKLTQEKLTGIGQDRNLIVLQVEALQTFVIGLNYMGQEITPNLNKLIDNKSSLYYDKYYQLLGRGNTSDAEFVSHNSLHPSMDGTTYTEYEKNTFYGLPLLLKDKGYTPWVMHGYKKEFWNREKAYVNQGFDRFISEEDYVFEDTIAFGLKDEDFYDQNIEFLKELDKIDDNPFYAFLVTLTSHTPFDMPKEHQVLDILPEHEGNILGNYLQSIHYADKHLGIFIENLKQEGLYENTVFAIYGDHFAISSAHEEQQKIMTDFLGYNYDYDSMMNIPLIIHVPGEEINEKISTVGSQIDFYPTILNIMGYENTKGLMMGRDITNFKGYNYLAPQTYMLKGSFIDKDTMFIMSRDGIFDHSKAYSMKTGKQTEIEPHRAMYKKVISEINKSDFILEKDLLKEYIENDGNVDLGKLAGLERIKKESIKELKENSLKELNKNYKKNHKLMAVKLSINTDKDIVLLKDNAIQMTLEDLVKWMEEHEGAEIIFKAGQESKELSAQAMKEYPQLRDIAIAEIENFEEYIILNFSGFTNIILNTRKENYKDEEILDFISIYPHYGVILDKERDNKDLIEKLNEKGLSVYIDGKLQ